LASTDPQAPAPRISVTKVTKKQAISLHKEWAYGTIFVQ